MSFNKHFLFSLGVIFLIVQINYAQQDKVLSRQKRYVAFPEGSSLIVAVCMTHQLQLPFKIFTEGVNWGMAYELPNATFFQSTSKHFLRRRHRRDLYNRMEKLIDYLGHDGRACIYRALCEAPRRLNPQQNTLSEDILQKLFNFPEEDLTSDEPRDHHIYNKAFQLGQNKVQQECFELFPTCSLSLIDLALGNYN